MWLVKVAYDGTKFFGSQIQPDVPTVNGEIQRALMESGLGGVPKFASRTDRGVSALCNVFCYRGERPRLGQLNSLLENIKCWGYAEVPEGFNLRKVKIKEYRYMLVKDYDVSVMRKAARYFVGEHDFRNYSKYKVNTVRTIDKIRVTKKWVSFRGKGFLWEQIRRIMRTLMDVGEGRLKPSGVKKLFRAESGIRPAAPEALVLWNIDHGIKFHERKVSMDWERELEHATALKSIGQSLTDRHI